MLVVELLGDGRSPIFCGSDAREPVQWIEPSCGSSDETVWCQDGRMRTREKTVYVSDASLANAGV